MVTGPEIKQVVDLVQKFGPEAGPVIYYLLKRLFETQWMDEEESEKLVEKMQNNPDEAARMIEEHEDSEEIEQNLGRLYRELETCDEDDICCDCCPEEIASEVPTFRRLC